MANVHGFRDINNQNQPNRANRNNNPRANNQPIGDQAEQIPFLSTMRSNRQPMEQSIPYTLKLVCCPDFRVLSVTFIFLVIIWVMYIVCLSQGIQLKNQSVLQVQDSVILDFGGDKGSLVKQGQVYRLLLGTFLHFNLMDIVMNSVSLLFLCTRFEKIYPRQTFIVLFGSALSSNLLTAVADPSALTAGAQVAIYGVLGGFIAFLIINWGALKRLGSIRSTIACLIVFLFFIFLLFSFGSSVDMIAYVGSVFAGLFLSFATIPGMQPKSRIFTIIGCLGIISMNTLTILMLFLTA